MAFSAITVRGSAVDTANDASIAMTPSADLVVGRFVVVTCQTKNIQTTDGASNNHSAVADDAGGGGSANVWAKIEERTETSGVAGDGSTVSIWSCRITTQIATTNTITLTTSGNIAEKIINCIEVTPTDASYTVSLAQVGIGQAAIAASVSSLASREYLLVGAAAAVGSDNAKTPDGDYTERFDLRSQNAAGAITCHVQTRIATLTSDTCTSTAWTNTNPITLLAAFYEEKIISLPVGALILAGRSVGVGFMGPVYGQLTITGQAPTVAISAGGSAIDVPAGSVVIQGRAPTLGYVLDMAAGTVRITGQAPTLFSDQTIPIPAGAVTFSGQAPSLAGATAIEVPAGSLPFTGWDVGAAFSGPNVGRLALTGYAPALTITAGTIIAPTVGSVALTGQAPALALGIGPAAGSLVWGGLAPSIAGTSAITLPAGTLSLGGQAPTLAFGLSLGAGAVVLRGQYVGVAFTNPAAGVLTLTGYAPTLAVSGGGVSIAPAAGAVALAGRAPSLSVGVTRPLPAGAVTLSSAAQTLAFGVPLPAGAVTITGTAPTLVGAGAIAPSAGVLAITGYAPAVLMSVQLGAGAVTLTGLAPTRLIDNTRAVPAGAVTFGASALTLGLEIAIPSGTLAHTGGSLQFVGFVEIAIPSASIALTGHALTRVMGNEALDLGRTVIRSLNPRRETSGLAVARTARSLMPRRTLHSLSDGD